MDYGPFRFRRSPSPSSYRHHKDNKKRLHSPENSADREKFVNILHIFKNFLTFLLGFLNFKIFSRFKRSKEERRRMFEAIVAREDEKKLYERHLQEFERESQNVVVEEMVQQQPTAFWDHSSLAGSTPVAYPNIPPQQPLAAQSIAAGFQPTVSWIDSQVYWVLLHFKLF